MRIFILLVLLATIGCSIEKPDYQQCINQLSAEHADAVVKTAYNRLKSGGVESMPFLVRNLKNEVIASSQHFQREEVVESVDGTFQASQPSIGDACEGILRQMLDYECSNKLTEDYSVIQADTFTDWWRSRSERSLLSLQNECRQQMLRNIQAELDVEKSTERIAVLSSQLSYLQNCKQE
jgi:hypothetical protein